MDSFLLSAITYFALFLGAWTASVVLMLGRILAKAKAIRGVCRTSDKWLFAGTLIGSILSFIVVFVWPGFIYMIPATVAFIEIASIPILGHVSELAFKHLRRMKNIPTEVDEHAAI